MNTFSSVDRINLFKPVVGWICQIKDNTKVEAVISIIVIQLQKRITTFTYFQPQFPEIRLDQATIQIY
jgi:hypothetical protein